MSLAPDAISGPDDQTGALGVGAAMAYAEDLRIRAHRSLLTRVRGAQGLALADRREEAAAVFRRLLEEHPGEPALWSGLASVSRGGDPEQAVACLERAVRLRPAHVPYLLQLADAYGEADRMREALDCLARADRLVPDQPKTLLLLGAALLQAGQGRAACRTLTQAAGASARAAARRGRQASVEATASLRSLRDLCSSPKGRSWRAVRLRHVGEGLLRAGRHEQAETFLRAGLATCRGDAELSILLARALTGQERHLDAREVLQPLASEQAARDDALLLARILTELGVAHLRAQEVELAREHLETALFVQPSSLRARRQLGWTWQRLGRHERAEACFEAARSEPGRGGIDATFGLATVRKSLGDTTAASALGRAVLQAEPRHTGALTLVVKSEAAERNEANLGLARRIAGDGGEARPRRIQAHFVAGRILDHLDRADEAFAHYREGNALKDVTYDRERMEAQAEAIIAATTPSAVAERTGWGDPSRRPIFIVGMPRSGSTLIEQILASHPQVHGGGELPFVPAFMADVAAIARDGGRGVIPLLDREETAALATHLLGRLHSLNATAARVTDKMLFNFWHLGHLATALPEATILHATRDPMDSCTSIFLHDFAGVHAYAYDLENIGHYHGLYRRLMTHWAAVFPGRIVEVPYEAMVAGGEAEMKRVVAACGLAWDERCARFHEYDRPVATSSDLQVRRPLYKGAIGRWRRYERQLAPLQAALGV